MARTKVSTTIDFVTPVQVKGTRLEAIKTRVKAFRLDYDEEKDGDSYVHAEMEDGLGVITDKAKDLPGPVRTAWITILSHYDSTAEARLKA